MAFDFSSRPNRRYLLRFGTSMTIMILAAVAGKYLIRQGLDDGPLVWVLALIRGLAMVGAIHAIGMLIIEQKDEFIRMLILRQVIIGTGIALSFATVWGFLEYFELVAHIYPFYVAVAWLAGFGFGGLVNRLTLGAWGEMS